MKKSFLKYFIVSLLFSLCTNIVTPGNAFTINLNEQNNNGTLKVITHVSYIGYSEKVLSPFEPVGIITNNPLPKYDATANLQGYYEAAVPALYLYWLKEKAETQANYALANVSLNLLGTVTGIGVAANATTWTVRILGALDATSGAIAAGLDVVPIEQAIANKYGANSPEHDFIKKIQLGLTIYNDVSAGANLLQLPQKLDEAVIYWNQNKQRLTDDLGVTQQQANQIDNLLREVNVVNAGDLANAFKQGYTKESILAIPKGKRQSQFLNELNTKQFFTSRSLNKPFILQNSIIQIKSFIKTAGDGTVNGTYTITKLK